jgi:hypothetical protein
MSNCGIGPISSGVAFGCSLLPDIREFVIVPASADFSVIGRKVTKGQAKNLPAVNKMADLQGGEDA